MNIDNWNKHNRSTALLSGWRGLQRFYVKKKKEEKLALGSAVGKKRTSYSVRVKDF